METAQVAFFLKWLPSITCVMTQRNWATAWLNLVNVSCNLIAGHAVFFLNLSRPNWLLQSQWTRSPPSGQLMSLNGQRFSLASFRVGPLKRPNPRPNHRAQAIEFHTNVYILVTRPITLQETHRVACNLEHFWTVWSYFSTLLPWQQ